MLRHRKKLYDEDENTQRWLLTYADLITLLLAFFIVMYSMSRLDAKRFGKMSDALSGILDGTSVVVATGTGAGRMEREEFNLLRRGINASLYEYGLDDKIETIQDDRGLVIRVTEAAAFDPGSADIKPQLYPVLTMIANDLADKSNHVRVEGHTDNTPIQTRQYPSNWELSTARATRVVRYMVEELHFDPERVSALGYAEYRPIASNASGFGRTRNRRVDIIVLAEENTRIEPVSTEDLRRIALSDSLLSEE